MKVFRFRTYLLKVIGFWPTFYGFPILSPVVLSNEYVVCFPFLISLMIASPLAGIYPLTAYSHYMTFSASSSKTFLYDLLDS